MNGDPSGRTLDGRYEVQSELAARNGQGLPRTDTVLGRPVAVKVLSAQYADDANFVDRFRREAQARAPQPSEPRRCTTPGPTTGCTTS
jgi:serine/threonine-protein kinase